MKRICKDCGTEIFVDRNMVMIKHDLWEKICDKHEDSICDECMENRLGRKITKRDFLIGFKKEMIPCNQAWLWYKEKKLKMKGTIKLIPVNEKLAEGKKVICGGWAATVMNYIDSNTCDVSIENYHANSNEQKRVYIADLKILVIEYHLKPMPEDRRFKRGHSLARYNAEMSKYEATRQTISLNPKQWQTIMDLSLINKKVEFSLKNEVATIELKKEKI